MEKLCVFCKHLDFYNDYGGEYAQGASISCKLGIKLTDDKPSWMTSNTVYDIEDFRKMIVRAKTCKRYTEVK